MTRLWRQYRNVNIDGTDYSGFDMDIEVVMPDSDPLEFEVDIYNLADETWDGIEKGDDVIIELGWEDGEQETVIFGEIDRKRTDYDEPDFANTIKGEDKSSKAVKAGFADVFRDRTPDQIVSEIANRLGLTAETDSVGRPIGGIWSMTSDRPVKYWLDELIDYAESLTGDEWEWHVEQGTVFFNEKETTFGDAPLLSYDTNLLSVAPNDDEESDNQKLEFSALLDPRIQKGQEVVIDTDRFSDVYKVQTYQFNSSSVSGDHNVEATVELMDDAQVREPFEERVLEAQAQMLAPF